MRKHLLSKFKERQDEQEMLNREQEFENNASSNTKQKVYFWELNEISKKISTYVGWMKHQYKLTKEGYWKKWKTVAESAKRYFRSQFKFQIINSENFISWIALDATESILNW